MAYNRIDDMNYISSEISKIHKPNTVCEQRIFAQNLFNIITLYYSNANEYLKDKILDLKDIILKCPVNDFKYYLGRNILNNLSSYY